MWTARGAFRNQDGKICKFDERSPIWIIQSELVAEVGRDHPGMMAIEAPEGLPGDWYSWDSGDGVERFVVIEEYEKG